MNELEKINGRQEIFNLLLDLEDKTKISWRKSFHKLSKLAGICSVELTRIKFIKGYRNTEEKESKKRTPSKILNKKIEIMLSKLHDQMKVDPNADIIYFPGSTDIDGYFQNQNAKYWIILILYPTFELPKNLEEDLNLSTNCALALRGAFYSLGCGCENGIPIKVVLRLLEIINDLVDKTRELRKSIDKQEEIGEQNSKNQKKSDQKEQRLKALKLHPTYPELFDAIKRYRNTGKGKDKTVLNRLLAEMTGIKNGITIRCYRNYLLEEYISNEKR